jgi:predicted metal-dependent HD superfamily phosphohydrolase
MNVYSSVPPATRITQSSVWCRLLQSYGVTQDEALQAFAELAGHYEAPGRFYHTLEHIHHVLATIDTLRDLATDLPATQLAAWFHDVIYDTRANDNEERSAAYAESALQAWHVPRTTNASVQRLILQTKHHQAPDHEVDGQILLDADLAILGASPTDYERYARAIRQEYAWVPEKQYRARRKQVLQTFLDREHIYYLAPMVAALEAPARKNLEREIQEGLRLVGPGN